MDEFRIGQNRRRAEQAESLRASGGGKIERSRTRVDEQIGEPQQRGRFDQLQIAGIDDLTRAASGDKLFCPRGIGRPADQKDGAGVRSPLKNSRQVASGQSLSGCEAPIPITIQGRARDANFSPTMVKTGVGSRKSGSVDGSGTFISTIKARSQSIG